MMLSTPQNIRTLQRKLYLEAKQEPAFRFYALYDKVYRTDILNYAYRLVRANKGSAGIDGVSFEAIESGEGQSVFLTGLKEALKNKSYEPSPVKRVKIPKADGSKRALGIPTIRDRVAQMAAKLVIEPIFEADFCDISYGFRPKRSAHDAVDDISIALNCGYTQVIDADISKYFDTIAHAKLLAAVAERIVDGANLNLIRMWLKSPVVEEGEKGTRRNGGAGKANRRSTPQGGVISPLLSNLYLHQLDRHWCQGHLQKRLEARLVRYHFEHSLLNFGSHPVFDTRLASGFFLKSLDTVFLVRFFNIVKMLARDAIDTAGLRNVLEVFGKFQYAQFRSNNFLLGGHVYLLIGLFGDNPEGI